jgi:hypothetical protein
MLFSPSVRIVISSSFLLLLFSGCPQRESASDAKALPANLSKGANQVFDLDDYWPMDKGNKWVYAGYVEQDTGEIEKFGQSTEVVKSARDEQGRKYWTVLSKSLDSSGSSLFTATQTFYSEDGYRYLSSPPIFPELRLLPLKIRVREKGVKKYCLVAGEQGCEQTIYTGYASLKRLLDPEWLEGQENEFGFNLGNRYGQDELLGTLLYSETGQPPRSGEPHYILKEGIGPVLLGAQFLQYSRIDGVEHVYFPY